MKLTAETTLRTDRGDYLAEWMMLTYTPISVVCSTLGWPCRRRFGPVAFSIEVPQDLKLTARKTTEPIPLEPSPRFR